MKNRLLKIISFTLTALIISSNSVVNAKQSTKSNPWGYTGLINMPTGEVLGMGEYYLTGNFLFRNTGVIGNAYMGIFDRLELGIVGGIPSAGFSGLAGNLKYQLIQPTAESPTSLAVGLSLVGLARDTQLITGNNLYMVFSHDFNLKLQDNTIYNIFSGHVGFSGNLQGARLMTGLDIPVTDYVNLTAEYMGRMSTFEDMINFGIKAKPLPYLTVSALTSGTSTTSGFANTEYFLTVSFNSGLQNLANMKRTEQPQTLPQQVAASPTPTPAATAKPVPQPTATPVPKPTVTPTATPLPQFGVVTGTITTSDTSKKTENIPVLLKDFNSKFNVKTETGKDGVFTLKEIPAGEYLLTVTASGYEDYKRNLMVKAGESTESNIVLKASLGSVSGKVLSAEGKPVSDLIVSVNNTKVTTDNEGRFSLADLGKGSQILNIHRNAQKLKSINIDITPNNDLKKEIVLDKEDVAQNKNSTIIGKITSKNAPLMGTRIMIEGDKITVMTVSANDGNYTIKNLPPGNYKMTISKTGYASRIFSIKVEESQEARHDVELVAQ